MNLIAKYVGPDRPVGWERKFTLKKGYVFSIMLSILDSRLVIVFDPEVTSEILEYSKISDFTADWQEVYYA